MAIGSSGRIVIEVDPGIKHDLYEALEREGLTLKHWFLRQAAEYVRASGQLPLVFSAKPVREGGQS